MYGMFKIEDGKVFGPEKLFEFLIGFEWFSKDAAYLAMEERLKKPNLEHHLPGG
jgi:hypothetical protein